MFVVADMWAGSLIGNLVDSGGNWVDETEQGIGVKVAALVAQDQIDSMKNLDGSSIPSCILWSMNCSWELAYAAFIFSGNI